MRAFVVSNQPSKRTQWFIETGRQMNVQIEFITYERLLKELPDYRSTVIKLEAPIHNESRLAIYHQQVMEYRDMLYDLMKIPHDPSVHFMNPPQSILDSQDKMYTNLELESYCFPRPSVVIDGPETFDEVFEFMGYKQTYSIFLKLMYGSGAGGVMAIRYNPRRDQWVAYTSLDISCGILYNTKKVNRFTRYQEIRTLAEGIIDTHAIVEEWVPKDQIEGESYDLRIVCQFGKVDHIVMRCSRSPITNLHLNNRARPIEELELSKFWLEEVMAIASGATEAMNLGYAGIDMLLSKESQFPYIIEVNGQGDHIYQDMYGENHIYTNQIRWMQSLNR